jgi:hypothetical protein
LADRDARGFRQLNTHSDDERADEDDDDDPPATSRALVVKAMLIRRWGILRAGVSSPMRVKSLRSDASRSTL